MNFSPDQTGSTAQTFTSTRPSGRKISRKTSSVSVVGRFDAFYGQETHSMPSGFNLAASFGASSSKADRSVSNTCA